MNEHYSTDSIFTFPTWKDERREITRGRITLILFGFICILVIFCFFQIKVDFASFWILRLRNHPQLNLPYAATLAFILFLIFVHLEPFLFLKVQRYTIPAKRLQNIPSIRIAHISDTHIHYPYPQVTFKKMKQIVEIINNEKVDFVVFTGDLISDNSKYAYTKDISCLTSALSLLKMPLFVCLGNHDVACRSQIVRSLRSITTIPVTVLEQETVEFVIPSNSNNIISSNSENLQTNTKSNSINLVNQEPSKTNSDYIYNSGTKSNSDRNKKIYISGIKPSLILSQTNEYIDQIKTQFNGDPNLCHILLAHMPDAADAAAASGLFDVQFSGHSHGGQCVLPFNAGTPILPPGSLKYHGCVEPNYRVGEMVLTVSRGVGVTPLPYPLIRFLCPPEISIVTLVSPTLL